MNEQNFDFLSRQLKYGGFGEGLQPELREKMGEGRDQFTLLHRAVFGTQETEAALQFKRSENADMYFLNNYLLRIKNENGEPGQAQSFGASRQNGITLKEAYNLMHGRAVYKELSPKEGEKFRAWLQLNFKEVDEFGNFKTRMFHDNYGFDLRKTLVKYPIKELASAETANSLVRSLERGNLHTVTMVQGGKEEKMMIEANPQFKTLNVYNTEGLRMNIHAEKMGLSEKTAERQTEKKNKKLEEGSGEGETEGPKQTQKQSKRHRERLS